MQTHRFRHCAAIALKGEGETRYMNAATARQLAAALVAIADSIETVPFGKSGGGLTVRFETFPSAHECPEGRGQ